MRSDNKNRLMRVNRFMASPLFILIRIILIDVLAFMLLSYLVNSIANISEFMADSSHPEKYFGFANLIPKFKAYSSSQKIIYIFSAGVIFVFNIIDAYKTRIAYSENDINQGQHGTRRWTTVKEIKEQFKGVPLKTGLFDGKPGFPMSRIKETLYIDDTLTNCLGLGSTRSGKGQGSIIQDVDVASRARDVKDRPSLIIADPKTENSRMMAKRLEERGYITRFLNLDEPSRSMGYNPLKLVIDYYKQGQRQKAQMAAKSFSFSIFNATDNAGQEPIWKNTATDLFTALQVAIASDCLDEDRKINETRKKLFQMKKNFYQTITEDEKTEVKKIYFDALKSYLGRELSYIKEATIRMIQNSMYDNTSGFIFTSEKELQLEEFKGKYVQKIKDLSNKEDVFYFEERFVEDIKKLFNEAIFIPPREDIEDIEELFCIDDPITSAYIEAIPDDAAFFPIYPNEKKVNAFSCILFFQDMCNRAAIISDSPEDFEKQAETAMDEYFNSRPPLDYAKALYLEIKSAGSKTKGSVYINMQSALSTFVLHDVAQMTAESDFDIESLGYGDKPVAVFMVIPSEDRSNHFIATTFIAQVYRCLFESAKRRTGKLDRNVIFILDEFGNLPPIENFAGMVTVGLGMGIAFHIYIQSYGQIYGKYKDDAQSILDNFATQQYIMSIGNDSAEEFSKKVGQTTVITTQRSGERFSTKKTYTESITQRPLIYEHELAVLREGESVIIRNLKRTDNLGVAVDSMPIINEYKDELSVLNYISIIFKILINRIINKRALVNPKTNGITTLLEEWKIRVNDMKRYLGTDALYAYQYLSDEFPSPDTVNFYDINRENRKHINIEKRVYSSEQVLERIKQEKRNLEGKRWQAIMEELEKEQIEEAQMQKKGKNRKGATMYFSEMKNQLQIVDELEKHLGEDIWSELGLSDTSTVAEVQTAILSCKILTSKVKHDIISSMKNGGD